MIWACTWICCLFCYYSLALFWPDLAWCYLFLFKFGIVFDLVLRIVVVVFIFYYFCNILYLLLGFICGVLILWHCFDLTIWVIVLHLPLFSTCFWKWLLLFYLLLFCKKITVHLGLIMLFLSMSSILYLALGVCGARSWIFRMLLLPLLQGEQELMIVNIRKNMVKMADYFRGL